MVGIYSVIAMAGKVLQMALWELDQCITVRKQADAGGKGLTGGSSKQSHIFHTQRWVEDTAQTALVIYHNDEETPPKSRENLNFGSARGCTTASVRR